MASSLCNQRIWAFLGGRVFKTVSQIKSNRCMLSTTPRRFGQEFQQEGIPGTNLPFGIGCKYKFTAGFFLFFASGFNIPFILTRFVLMSANMEAEDTGEQELSQTVCFQELATEKENEEEEEEDDEADALPPCPTVTRPGK